MKRLALKPVRSSRFAVLCVCGAAVLLAGLGVYRVHLQHQVVRLGYQLGEATVEKAQLEEEHRRLELERSVLTSPERIERLAESMGMVRPGPEQIRTVRSRTSVAAAGLHP